MSYKFPVALNVVGKPKIACRFCDETVAELRSRDADGYLRVERVMPDGRAHECAMFFNHVAIYCRFCGQRVFPEKFPEYGEYNDDGSLHCLSCRGQQEPKKKKSSTTKKGVKN